ncbi:MAG: GC-type dockerin domain-anchored protein [Phycisphaerales bacterium]|jgi:hypothetical protein|nr:GC-type dockerin domain-anchored protein [Phycisphaerales bacterium]
MGASACVGAVALSMSAGEASAQFRVASWNLNNYTGGLASSIQTAVYGVSPGGQSMSPTLIVAQGVAGDAAAEAFRVALNGAAGGPIDWARAPYVDGPGTDVTLFYRTTRVVLLNTQVVSTGGALPLPPRNAMRFDVIPVAYDSPESKIAIYGVHAQAGVTGNDIQARFTEADRIRSNAELLPAGWNFMVVGTLNSPTNGDAAYVELTGSQPNNSGRSTDCVRSPGNWQDTSFKFLFNTNTIGTGMVARVSQLLLSTPILDTDGMQYIGSLSLPFSTTTFNDPNHSFRTWGNDGSQVGAPLRIVGNTMVGQAVAQAIVDLAAGSGHTPIFADLKLPARVDSEDVLFFGPVAQGAPASINIHVSNVGSTALWTASGIDTLKYTMVGDGNFTPPVGNFTDSAGGASNTHAISINTSVAGPLSGSITINSNAPDEPARVVLFVGSVQGSGCLGDWDHSGGQPNSSDFLAYLNDYSAQNPAADLAPPGGNGVFDSSDFLAFLNLYSQGC